MQGEYQTACGGRIHVRPQAVAHLEAHPGVQDWLSEAIKMVRLPEHSSYFLKQVIPMGRVIGRSGRVEAPPIEPHEPSLFAYRLGRPAPSRVARTQGQKTRQAVIIAAPDREHPGDYSLVTAWAGTLGRKEPWDRSIRFQGEYETCLRFWCFNALVWDASVMSTPFESSWSAILEAGPARRPLLP